MKRVIVAAFVIASIALVSSTVNARAQSVAGTWTFTVEHLGLELVLEQKDTHVTGTLDWPHGDPIKLTGALEGNTLTFAGDSSGENFTIHLDSTGSLEKDGTLAGTLKAHFVDFNDAHQVVRTHDQEIAWTATRGLHGVVHFPR
jgi:hypothetical protein